MSNYGMSKDLKGLSIDEAEEKVTAALKEQGFGVLTRIDVSETLKTKIDVDFRPYRILGACNPRLAHEALSAEDDIGLLLPCNVVLDQQGDGVRVSAADPDSMFKVVDNDGVKPVADKARELLEKALAALG